MFRAIRAAAGFATAIALTTGAAACSVQYPAAATAPGQGGMSAPALAGQGATTRVGAFVEVIDARIPAPPSGSVRAQVEMTLANTSTTGGAALLAARSPAARHIIFTSRGRTIPRITIPVSAGAGLTTGPPYQDRILLTGLRHTLRPGQLVSISFMFARAGRVALHVPVVPALP
jgi:copper(I)-binding protein